MRVLFFSIELIFQSVLDITFVSKLDRLSSSCGSSNNGNKFPMGEAPILIAKITINTYENNNTTLIFESDNGQNINRAVPVCFDFRR
jgi:hypothetical protein